MGSRFLDDTYAPEVRQSVTLLTLARLVENAGYRYAPPYLATIASGLDVSLTTIGVALSITELGGLLSPVLGRLIDGWPRRGSLVASGFVVAVSAGLAAASNGMVVFTIALLALALAKSVFDMTLNAWIADHVEYARRARVVGIVEMSWAGGLLIGVPILGLITAASSWRVAFVVAGVAMALGVTAIARRLPPESRSTMADRAAALPDHDRGWARRLAVPMLGFMFLMASSQCAFVTFGSWLEEAHGFSTTALAAITFVLGGFELIASTSTMRLTDRLGKQRSMVYGALVIVPSAGGLALGLHRSAPAGLLCLCLLLLGFEFAIVSGISLASNLVPGRPGSGLGAVLGAGTVGRGIAALAATSLFDARGMAAPMALAAATAVGCIACFAGGGSGRNPHLANG